jgi:hypothetical protein
MNKVYQISGALISPSKESVRFWKHHLNIRFDITIVNTTSFVKVDDQVLKNKSFMMKQEPSTRNYLEKLIKLNQLAMIDLKSEIDILVVVDIVEDKVIKTKLILI